MPVRRSLELEVSRSMRYLVLLTVLGACVGRWAIAADDPTSAAAQRRAMGGDKAFGSVVPRSNEPTGELTVLRIWPDRIEMRIAVAALQGLVNRDRPKLYIGIDKPLRWLEYYSGKTVTKIEPDVFAIFEKFKSYVKGIVVYDNSLDALANVAITYAGVEDLIPAGPDLAQTLSDKFGWKVVHDLRGRWTGRVDAYRWAYENLFPKCSKSALTHYNHGYRGTEEDPFGMDRDTGKTGFAVDYAVEFRTFTWHVPTEPTDEEVDLAEKIMESVPFHTPIFGRSSTQDTFPEPAFVAWVAKFGNLHIPAGMSNTSVLSGARVPPALLRQKQRPVRHFDPNKVYVAFTISEKDNLQHVIGGGPPWHRLGMEMDDPYRIWWSDPWRGRVALGWPVGPLVADLAPTTLAHFMTTATDNDCFLAALSGLCLSEPESYGAAYPEIQDELLDEYVKLTGEYMNQLGWTQVQPVGPPSILRRFARSIPNLRGMMEGYGPHKGMTYEKANYLLDGVPVFHALTEGTFGTSRSRPLAEVNREKARKLADQIASIDVGERPAFIHAWVNGWDFGPTTLKMAADMLPGDYAVVRPDELAALYKKSGTAQELTSASPPGALKGIVTETANGDEGLVVDTGEIKVEIGWGKDVQPPVKRIMGVDGKWRGAGRLNLHNPRGMSVKAFTSKKVKDGADEKEYVLRYSYGEGSYLNFRIRALAGRAYLLIEHESRMADLPSWGFETYTDFEPDVLYTDAGSKSLDYKSSRSMGSLPWSRWMLVGKRNGPERDLIGVFAVSWIDWTNGQALLWQRTPAAYFEFYQSRSGRREFALAALDRNDAGAPERIWNELNGR